MGKGVSLLDHDYNTLKWHRYHMNLPFIPEVCHGHAMVKRSKAKQTSMTYLYKSVQVLIVIFIYVVFVYVIFVTKNVDHDSKAPMLCYEFSTIDAQSCKIGHEILN